MAEQVAFKLRNRNPDVLTCIANLSNDEVFTPPEFANKMLDLVAEAWADAHDGASIWNDSSLRFLDPFTKSGVFLREITSRLVHGLEDEFPDLEKRVDHILTHQVFGIAITNLTSLVARRSVYCSKWANGKHSIAKSLSTEAGNIWFEPLEHTWVGATDFVETADEEGKPIRKGLNGKCEFCGASQRTLDRGPELESHAYAFIHTDDIEARITELFGDNMEFDVIIGNPPYQINSDGNTRTKPIYHYFVEQAFQLDPRFVVLVTPSRWFAGGLGLDDFRERMLNDRRIRALVDYRVEKDAFPGVNVNGGVSYFLWDRNYNGPCSVRHYPPGGPLGEAQDRYLDEFDMLIRQNEAVEILRKVVEKSEPSFAPKVSSQKPFDFHTNFHGADDPASLKTPVRMFGARRVTWVERKSVVKNEEWIDQWKVLLAAASDGNEILPLPIWDMAVGPFVAAPGEICSGSYLVVNPTDSQEAAERTVTFLRTRFVRFLVSLRKIAQHNTADRFAFVPDLPMDRAWTDDELYARYGLSDKDISFIESSIRPMDHVDG